MILKVVFIKRDLAIDNKLADYFFLFDETQRPSNKNQNRE